MKMTMVVAVAAFGLASAAQAQSGTYAYTQVGQSDGYGGVLDGQFDRDGSQVRSISPAASTGSQWAGAGLSGSASASANLATGGLGAFSQSYQATPWSGSTDSFADASLADRLTFTIAGAGADTITTIGIEYTFHGFTVAGIDDLYYAASSLHFGSAGLQLVDGKNGGQPATRWGSNLGNFTGFSVTDDGETMRAHATFSLVGASSTHDLLARLYTRTGGNATANFANTSLVRFTLPDTVTMTSQSGVFLSQVGGAVPESSAWALLILGLGLTGAGMRRAKQRRRAELAFA